MINLLPKSLQKKLGEERNFRVAMILAITGITALLSFSLMLGLLQVFYWEKSKAADIAVAEKEQEAKSFDIEAVEKKISGDNSRISKLKKIYDRQIKIGDVFRQTAEALPAGVVLESFAFASGKIGLAGRADRREALASFKANLENQKNFKNVVFPPESWISEKDIKFTATLSYGI
jgi:Tfp pilus assembly protein PilN